MKRRELARHLWGYGVVPEFGGDEELRSGDAALLDGGADHGFGSIDCSCQLMHQKMEGEKALTSSGVDMSIAGLESSCYSFLLIILTTDKYRIF